MITIPNLERSSFPINRLLVFGIFFLCAYAAWACGGIRPALQWPLPLIASALCATAACLPSARNRIWEDPIFRAGAPFFLLLVLQWLNSGHGVQWGDDGLAAMDSAPSKWWPWSVGVGEAGEMLSWFFPAWTVLLVIRNILTRPDIKILLHLLAWNSAALAFVGLLQYLGGAERILGIWEVPYRIFFATFAYPNHAAEWFYLHAALSAGLLHDALLKRKPPVRIVVWGACFMLCVVATFLTLSRAGAFVALGLLLAVLSIFMKRALKKNLSGVAAINIYMVMGSIALAGLTLFLGVGGGSLAREVGGKSLIGEMSVAGDLAVRVQQMPYAWDMIEDYPLFGTGGWGYASLLKFHLPQDQWAAWIAAGKANIHCDPIQFLSEFGMVGMLCMIWVLVTLIRSVVFMDHFGKMQRWILTGVLIVWLHSLIDWPFRCPAVLLGWCSLFAALPILAQKRQRAEEDFA
jgi:hypothetical protein